MSANYGAKLQDITDGTPNTFMVCELRAGMTSSRSAGRLGHGLPRGEHLNAGRDSYNPTPNNLMWSDIQSITAPALLAATNCRMGLCMLRRPPAWLGMGCNYEGQLMTSAMSRSMHPAGVNVCMCDGSVHFILNQIDELNWCRYGSPRRTGS